MLLTSPPTTLAACSLMGVRRGHACGRRQPPLPAGGPAAVALANGLLCHPWSAEIRAADVLVLNAGAHGVPDDGYVSLMRLASQFARQQRRPGALHLFRNTPFGHHNCSLTKHAPPLPSLRAAELALAREPQYDWLAFKRRNQLAKPIFAAQANPNPNPSPSPNPNPNPNPNQGFAHHYCLFRSFGLVLAMHGGGLGLVS